MDDVFFLAKNVGNFLAGFKLLALAMRLSKLHVVSTIPILLLVLSTSVSAQDFFKPASNDKATIALLESKIRSLEAENASLRAQLRTRDADKQPTPAVEQSSKITMQSIPGCLACELWYESERPKLVASGWIVDRETVTSWPAGRVFPRWRVCTGKLCVDIENCSASQFMERLRAIVAR